MFNQRREPFPFIRVVLFLFIRLSMKQNNVCEVAVSYKNKTKASERPQIVSSKSAYEYLSQVYDENTVELREYFKVVLLNQANRVLGYSDISFGGIDGTYCDVRHIMQVAILSNATGIILSHNHPSGNTEPSLQDKRSTAAIQEACKFMKINLIDHMIIARESYYSFADEGIL